MPNMQELADARIAESTGGEFTSALDYHRQQMEKAKDEGYTDPSTGIYHPGRTAFDASQSFQQAGLGQAQDLMSGRMEAARQSALMDTGQSQQVRAQQMGLLSSLAQRAGGRGPSLAESQLQSGLEQALRAQAGSVASAGGSNRALAQRQAMNNAAMMRQQTSQDAARLRSQEQMAAQAALTQALSGVRGQDFGQAQSQAQMNLQAQLQSGAQRDAFLQALAGQGTQMDAAQLQAQIQRQGMLADQAQARLTGQTQEGIAKAQRKADRQNAFIGGGMSAGGALLGKLF